MEQALIDYLSGFVTPRRLDQFRRILGQRTRYLTVVLEDIYQPHNASAVLRSCECFGLQDVHIIENRNLYRVNPDVALGASRWLSLHHYRRDQNNTSEALDALKKAGYRLVATSPKSNKSTRLEDYQLKQGRTALLFGTELTGLSDVALEMADEFLYIPMAGFTDSFNISVSLAIVLYQLTSSLRKSDIPWQLEEEEKQQVMLQWLKESVKKSDLLIKKFHMEQS